MPLLIVVCVIACIFAVIFTLKATLTIEYRDELKLSVKVLFLDLKILPKREKKIDPKDFSPRKYRRMVKKKQKKELRAYRKKQKKKQAKLEKKALAKEKKKTGEKPSASHGKSSLLDNVNLIKELVSLVCGRFTKKLRIKLTRINIVIGTDDAAKTAILYGLVSQSVAYTLEILDRVTNLAYTENAEVSVDTDFLATKPTADVCISFSLRVCNLFDIAFRALGRFVSVKSKGKNKK